MTDTLTWLTPGAAVVHLVRDTLRGWTSVRPRTVDRVLTRDVVLDQDERWNHQTQRTELDGQTVLRRNRGSWANMSDYLVPADHPAVAQARTQVRRTNAKNAALSAVDNYRSGEATAADVAAAWAILAEHEQGAQS